MLRKPILLEAGHSGHGILIEGDAGHISQKLSVTNGETTTLLENKGIFSDKKFYINCILQKANTKNRNGRIYPMDILRKQVEEYMQFINDNNAGGECNHPNDITIDVSNISHRVVKVWWEGETLFGTLEILVSDHYAETGQVSTMIGDRIAELLKKGYKLGISSRGVGSVKSMRGIHYVQNDFELVCFDIVSSPSTPNAYLFQDTTPSYVNESTTESGIILQNTPIITEKNTINEGLAHKITNFLRDYK
jgi:hypothetical protein